MDLLLQYNMEQLNGASVPSPVDNTGDIFWWDRGAKEVASWAQMGITDVLLSPDCKGASQGGGYDPFSQLDLGNLSPTRFGWRVQEQRFCAIQKRWGMGTHIDFVGCHMDGGKDNGYTYDYKSASGQPGRFPKDRTCFDGPHSKKDWAAAPSDDFAGFFGRALAYRSSYYRDGKGSNGRGYVFRNMLEAMRWHGAALDTNGWRIDNGKSSNPVVLKELLRGNDAKRQWAATEFFDGNPDTLSWFVFDSGLEAAAGVFDFPFFFMLRDLANNASGADMRRIRRTGTIRRFPMLSTTFCENHDFDAARNGIKFNKEFAVAIACASEGLFCSYYKDLTPDGGYGLERLSVPNTFWCRRMFANGPTVFRYDDEQVSVWERTGEPGLIAGFNREPFYANTRYVTIPTTRRNCHWHDYSGNGPDVRTDANGVGTFPIPSGPRRGKVPDSGPGWVFYAPDGYQGHTLPRTGGSTTQRFEGAGDLDIWPATPDGKLTMRIWCDEKTPIILDKPKSDGVRFEVKDPEGNVIIPKGSWRGESKDIGYYEIRAFSPGADPADYLLDVTYTATETLTDAQIAAWDGQGRPMPEQR